MHKIGAFKFLIILSQSKNNINVGVLFNAKAFDTLEIYANYLYHMINDF